MKATSIKISVIIPVYDSEQFLKKCLDSVLAQNYTNWEVIAIDDGSTDNSYKILMDYADKDARFLVFTQENKGPGLTRNRAMRNASGDYFVFLDSDDWIEKDYFQAIVDNVMYERSDVIFVDVIQEDPSGKLIKKETMSAYKGKNKDIILRHQMTGKLPWGGCRKSVKASLIVDNNICYSHDPVGEEAVFSFKVLSASSKISFIDKALYHYVNHPNSQSKKGNEDPLGEVCVKMTAYLKEINSYQEYRTTLCSFGFTALIVSIYRITQYNKFMDALRKSRDALKKYKKTYGFELDEDSLELRTRCVLPFAIRNMLLPIVVIAKLKSMFNGGLVNLPRHNVSSVYDN